MSCSLIIDTNLIDQRVSYDASSENASYPASNVLDISKRKRTWRTAGNFVIESGSNTLVIKDVNGGPNLTATITAGTYASDALFFAALKSALEAASDSTFTITRNTTSKKIVITAVLGGAATHFEIVCTHANSAAMCGILGFSTAANRTGALAYTADLIRIHTSEWIEFDFGAPVSPTAFLAVADRNRPLKVSLTATVRLQGNSTATWSSPQVNELATVNDRTIGLADEDGIGGTACRYWRVLIQDVDNSYGFLELGAIVIGTHAVLARGAPVFPLEVEEEDLSQKEKSEGGTLVGSKRDRTDFISLNFEGCTKADLEVLEDVAETYGTHSVFAVMLDTEGAFSSDVLKWARLVSMEQAPRKRLVRPNNWTVSWLLREAL